MAEMKFGGRTFRVRPPLATAAIHLQARLFALVGSGVDRLPAILAGVGKDKTEDQREAGQAAALAALTDIFAKCKPDIVTTLIKDVAEMAEIQQPSGDYMKVDLDSDFADMPGQIYPFIFWVLKEVLRDFFSGLQASGTLKRMMATEV